MQTIYLTDTDELPKKRMQQTIKKPSMLKRPQTQEELV